MSAQLPPVWLRLDCYEPGSNPCNLYFFNLDSVCGELFTEEAIEREILALKFWVSGLLSLITGQVVRDTIPTRILGFGPSIHHDRSDTGCSK